MKLFNSQYPQRETNFVVSMSYFFTENTGQDVQLTKSFTCTANNQIESRINEIKADIDAREASTQKKVRNLMFNISGKLDGKDITNQYRNFSDFEHVFVEVLNPKITCGFGRNFG